MPSVSRRPSVRRVPSLLWVRRDLRRRDNPALNEAAADGPVLPLFVLDPRLWDASGDVRRAWLLRSLRALDASFDGALVVRSGDPRTVVPAVAAEVGADRVHVAADFGPYGAARDAEVQRQRLLDALGQLEPRAIKGPVARRISAHFDGIGAREADRALRRSAADLVGVTVPAARRDGT